MKKFSIRKEHNFVLDANGSQRYKTDGMGNDVYRRRDPPFACDANNRYFYGCDCAGNQFYPIRNKKSVFIADPHTGTPIFAKYADGTQRYPTDDLNNEYYMTVNNEPYLLRKPNGEVYLAKTRKGSEMIPWNCANNYFTDEPHIYMRDAAGNSVYIKETQIPRVFQSLIRCICQISVICPKFITCTTKLV